jgi:hypothetical protein
MMWFAVAELRGEHEVYGLITPEQQIAWKTSLVCVSSREEQIEWLASDILKGVSRRQGYFSSVQMELCAPSGLLLCSRQGSLGASLGLGRHRSISRYHAMSSSGMSLADSGRILRMIGIFA